MRSSQSSAVIVTARKRLNNSDVRIVLVAHPFARACAVDQWQSSSGVSHHDVWLCLNKQPDWEGNGTRVHSV